MCLLGAVAKASVAKVQARFTNPTMHQFHIKIAYFVTEMCICVHGFVTKQGNVGYYSDALWDFWDGTIEYTGQAGPMRKDFNYLRSVLMIFFQNIKASLRSLT